MHSSVFHHKKKKKKPTEEMSLQITSMADIFTIILVFLLKTTASGINTVSPNTATLPVANGAEITHDTLALEVSRNLVTVDDKPVMRLQNFSIPLNEVEANGMSESVYRALTDDRKNHASDRTTSDLLVLADQDTPYSTLKTILASAANSGFVDLQLVVVENN